MPDDSPLGGAGGTARVSPATSPVNCLASSHKAGRTRPTARETIMTPDTQQAQAGYRRPQFPGRETSATIRSGALAAEEARTGPWGAVAPPHASPQSRAEAVIPRESAPPYPPGIPRESATPRACPTEGRAYTGQARRTRIDASIVGVIPLLAVLVAVVAGVYIAWRQGSAGGGEGGVVSGSALLVAAVIRLVVPARLAGLLATRKRATDVLTLVVFGAGLLVAGLVLPR
jgi:hypothetical protein